MTPAVEVLERLTTTVDHLRVTVDDGLVPPHGAEATEWRSCQELVHDAGALAALVATVATGRDLDRTDIALSVLAQGYAYRIASVAIGAWVLDGAVLDVDPRTMAVSFDQDRPRGVRITRPRTLLVDPAHGPEALALLHRTLVHRHLAPFVATARRAAQVGTRVGARLLWANVGSSCASSFGAFLGPLPDRRAEVRALAEAFFAAAPIELARSGRVQPVGSVWAWERTACCLWYQLADGGKCSDCSLWSPEERRARYDRVLVEEAAR